MYDLMKIENCSKLSRSYAMNVNAKFDVHTVMFVPISTLVHAEISLTGLWNANIFTLFILPSRISKKIKYMVVTVKMELLKNQFQGSIIL